MGKGLLGWRLAPSDLSVKVFGDSHVPVVYWPCRCEGGWASSDHLCVRLLRPCGRWGAGSFESLVVTPDWRVKGMCIVGACSALFIPDMGVTLMTLTTDG